MDQEKVLMDFNNLGEGALASEFQENYKSLLSKLCPGEKGTISISIIIERSEDATTIAAVDYSITSKSPKRKRRTLAQIAGDENGEMILKVDAPPIKNSNIRQLKLAGESE